jgi:hypothetical protein
MTEAQRDFDRRGARAGGDPGVIERPRTPPPPPPPAERERGGAAADAPPRRGAEAAPGAARMIQGLTHRVLAYLFLERARAGPRSDELRRFFFYFEKYANLAMWKARPSTPMAGCDGRVRH